MRRASSLDALRGATRPVFLAVGVMDGVHRGHRAVIGGACRAARAAGGEAWVLTFEPHPVQVLDPGRAPPLITTPEEKLEQIAEAGADGCIVLPFTPELAAWEPAAFVDRLAAAAPSLRGLSVGAGWRFGRRARGDVKRLAELAAARGIGLAVAEPVLWDGAPVSSTRIRNAVSDGRMEEAAALLGRRFRLAGPVREGRRVGRAIGYPTANVDTVHGLKPPHGVYAVRAVVGGREHPAAAYYGPRPTFDARGHALLEVYLLDGAFDLYGRRMEVAFESFVRPDRAFDSPEALRAQIARDVEAVSRVLAG